ncbi:MAG: beta-ketoacyl-ACP reductase [Flavobacteriales bacterium]|nr:beta-ketoacyl-ACP reductase [Flavobacteriales bacterium]
MLKRKTALVTGSGRGIGKAIALDLARNGANIILNDIEVTTAEETAKEINALGVTAHTAFADISDFDSCVKMIEEIKAHTDHIDILVNNAGILLDNTIAKMSSEEWNKVINVNVNGLFNVTKNVLEVMPDGGSIINISSVSGVCGNYGQVNYATSKAGVVGFTKTLNKELGRRNITANAIAPGFIKTEMTDKVPQDILERMLLLVPSRKMGTVDDIAGMVTFLASDKGRYISGQCIRIDGGLMF